ncbi:hypothetical protein RJ640_003848 [Escallonia rubra]|uniref:FAD synthase n=1 Tax=Escallonia rubra TaxID=112253 RepID=A0AA88R7W0_9ASTE|nr:hypothetical protein RJ640_003848 [Escallonia rubra]
MPFTSVIANLQSKQQKLVSLFFCPLLEWQKSLAGNLAVSLLLRFGSGEEKCSVMARQVEFSKVRSLTPRQFVEKLSKELGVRGVVAGENYRFGYRAAGDASDLVKLCKEYGLGAYIINPVMDKSQDSGDIDPSGSKERGQVSSTRVRYALAKGDMKYVTELLGRQHRLMLMVNDQERFTRDGSRVSVPKSCLLNLPPKEGLYQNCSLIIGDGNFGACKVVIDTTHIHLELDELATCIYITSQDFRCLSIDFGESTD